MIFGSCGNGPHSIRASGWLRYRPCCIPHSSRRRGQLSNVRGFVENLREADVSGFWPKFLHVVNHASYHRGQVTTMLRQLGVAIPRSQDIIIFYKERSAANVS